MSSSTQKAAFIKAIGLFDGLRPGEIARMADVFKPVQYAPGELIVAEGSVGEAMWLLERGAVEVHRAAPDGAQRLLATLQRGAVIGEMAMLDGQPCSASVTTTEPCAMYRVDAAEFVRMRLSFEPVLYKIFRNLTMMLCERLRSFNERLELMRQDPDTVVQNRIDHLRDSQEQSLATAPGMTMEFAFEVQEIGPSTNTTATSPSLMGSSAGPMVKPVYNPGTGHPDPSLMLDFLRQLPIFLSMLEADLQDLSMSLLEMRYRDGALICQQGERGGDFYIVAAGKVDVQRRGGDNVTRHLATLEPGAMFGAVSLIDGGERSATCIARSDDTTLLALSRRDFDMLWNANSPLAFRFIEIIGIDLAQRLRTAASGVDR